MTDATEPTSLLNQPTTGVTDPGAEPASAVNALEEPAAASEPAASEPAPAPAAPEPAPEAPPLTAEQLTLPEGVAPDPEALASFVEFANGAQLAPEQAQAALDLYHAQVSALQTQIAEQWETTQKEWADAARALPEIGGPNLDRTLSEVASVIDRYGSQDLRTALDVTGAGNHPAVVQFLHRIASVINERPPVSGQPTSTTPKSRAERLYGGTN